MGHTFPTVDWVQALADRLNAIPAYRESSNRWQGKLVLVAMAEPGLLPEEVAISLDPSGGTIKDVERVPDYKTSGGDYVLRARYSVWKDVIKGKHDILFGVMTGKIKLHGSVFKLMLQLKTPAIMLKEMRAMDTAFYDENQVGAQQARV